MIIAVNKKTKEKMSFNTVNDASVALNIPKKNINRALQKIYQSAKGWEFNELEVLPEVYGEDHYKTFLTKVGISEFQVKTFRVTEHLGKPKYTITFNPGYETCTRLENYIIDIKKYISSATKPTLLKKTPSLYNLALDVSDIHIGMDPKRGIFNQVYNLTIVKEQIDVILLNLSYEKETYKRFDKFYLRDLGDSLDGYSGYTTRGGHKLPQNLNNKEQYLGYIEAMCYLINGIIDLDICNEIDWWSTCNSNHDGDFAFFAQYTIKQYIELKKLGKAVIQTQFIDHYILDDSCYIICHGKDDTAMKRSLPFHLDKSTELYIKQYIELHKITARHIHFIKGDLHRSNEEWASDGSFRYVNRCAFSQPSEYAQFNFGRGISGIEYEITNSVRKTISRNRILF